MSQLKLQNRTILKGDVLEQLSTLPDKSIDCVITSPPYWGLRDYGEEGQWGLEPDFHDYLKSMDVFMEAVHRVLKDTGTVWINLGDSYVGGGGGPDSFERHQLEKEWSDKSIKMLSGEQQKKKWFRTNLPNKTRCGIPERFYINCIDSGWIARNHIPWYKANSMPSSVKDRFTNKWESIFFFAKQQKYYFNLDAVRQKTQTETKPFNVRVRDTDKDRFLQKALDSEVQNHNEKGERNDWKDRNDEQWDKRKWAENKGQNRQGIIRSTGGFYPDGTPANNPNGKNPGDVFFINPRPFAEAHFATFPVDLPTKILKCACPPDGMCLDPFFGAGTVGLAAEQLALQWIGIELKQEYIDIARKRLDPFKNERLAN